VRLPISAATALQGHPDECRRCRDHFRCVIAALVLSGFIKPAGCAHSISAGPASLPTIRICRMPWDKRHVGTGAAPPGALLGDIAGMVRAGPTTMMRIIRLVRLRAAQARNSTGCA